MRKISEVLHKCADLLIKKEKISKEEFEALFQDDCDGKNESPVIDNIQENQLND